MYLKDLDTPALFVDLDIMMNNIKEMHSHLKKCGVKCRPHFKTHKVPALAHIQIQEGAKGIACQKIGEAEVLVNCGIKDILICYNIVGECKLDRLVRLAKQAKITVVADSEVVVRDLSKIATKENCHLDILVECDLTKRRSGVRTPYQASELAQIISGLTGLTYKGLLQFKGGFPDESFIIQTADFFRETIELLNKINIHTEIISSGGTVYAWTAWPKFSSDVSVVNECRPGTYIFYDRMKVLQKVTSLDKCAARILTTIVSKPEKGRVIIDAGAKSLGIRSGHSGHDLGSGGYIVEYPKAIITSLFEEHGVVDNCSENMKVGQEVTIIPNYIDDITNVFDTLYGIRNCNVEAIWPILGRGKSQ